MPSEFVIITKFSNFKRLFYNLYVHMFSESFVVLIIDGAALGIFCKWIWPTEKPRLLTLFTFSNHYRIASTAGIIKSSTMSNANPILLILLHQRMKDDHHIGGNNSKSN